MATVEEIKAGLEERLGRAPRDDIWAHMVRKRMYRRAAKQVQGTFEFDSEIELLEGEYRDLALLGDRSGNLGRRDVARQIPPDARLVALAEILALDAARLPDVADFRHQHLPDGLLDETSVGAWVRSRAPHVQRSVTFATLPVPPDFEAPPQDATYTDWLDALAAAVRKHPMEPGQPARSTYYEALYFRAGDEFDLQMLHYPDELAEIYDPEPRAQRVLVSPGTELWQLRSLSQSLTLRYGWAPAAATDFVLTGSVPPLPKARAWIHRRDPFTALTRVALEVDPRLTQTEVRGFYGELRSKLRGGGDQKMSDKHIQLALFIARDGSRRPRSVGLEIERVQHLDRDHRSSPRLGRIAPDTTGEGTPWDELKKRWNAEHPAWAYDDDFRSRRFSRDVRTAWLRVTGQPWWAPLTVDEAEGRR